ncbi:MAG: hypothetical protein SNF93_07880 [Rikenellaceae bacterium]
MKRVLILASLLLFASCEREEGTSNSETNETMKSLTVAVSVGTTESRVAIDEGSGDSAWNLVWVEDDFIEVWYDGCSALSTFAMVSHDPELSTFSGSVGEQVNEIRVIHTTSEAGATLSGSDLSIDLSAQNGALDKTYMMSDDVVSLDESEALSSLAMKHVGGFFAIYLKVTNVIEGVEYKVTKLSIDGMPTTATIDLTSAISDKLYDDDTLKGVTTATVDETISAEAETELRLNILPFTYAAGNSLSFEITFEINGNTYTDSFVKTNSTENDILFERAKYNYSTITLDGTTGAIEVTDCTITPWGEGNDGSGIINTQIQ